MNLQVAMDNYRTAKAEHAKVVAERDVAIADLKRQIKAIESPYNKRISTLKEAERFSRDAAIALADGQGIVGQYEFPNTEWVRITLEETAEVVDLDALLQSPHRDIVIASVVLNKTALELAKRGKLPSVVVLRSVKAAFHFVEEAEDA